MHYRCRKVFSLRQWSAQIHTEFHVFHATWEHIIEAGIFRIRGYNPLWLGFSTNSPIYLLGNSIVAFEYNTTCPATLSYATARTLARMEFRLFPVRSSLLRKSLTISFPPGTEIFHFPGLSLLYSDVRNGLPHSDILG
jgi:hypothetical protein